MLENIYNQRVTILNKLKRTDSKTGVDVWRKSTVDDVVWYTKSSRSAGSSSVFIGTYITVLFPFNSRYLPYMEWKKPGNQEEHFTMSSGDYIILRVQYDSTKFDYKLAYVDYIKYGKVIFNIQGINVLRTPIKVTDFCILPSYTSDNFYK